MPKKVIRQYEHGDHHKVELKFGSAPRLVWRPSGGRCSSSVHTMHTKMKNNIKSIRMQAYAGDHTLQTCLPEYS